MAESHDVWLIGRGEGGGGELPQRKLEVPDHASFRVTMEGRGRITFSHQRVSQTMELRESEVWSGRRPIAQRSRMLVTRATAPVRKGFGDLFRQRCDRLLAGDKLRILLIVGHMRSGSSLLVHVLNTNPGIAGYGETHRTYRETRDLTTLVLDVCLAFRRLRLSGTYFMDKLVFDYVRNEKLLESQALRLVFLLRHPIESLPSMIEFRRGVMGHAPAERPFDVWTEELALRYYLDQLGVMERYAAATDPQRLLLLTYEELTHDPDAVLQTLDGFLELKTPLSNRYRTTWATGRRGVGDTSPQIGAGRIVKAPPRRRVSVSQRSLEEATAAFVRCRARLAALSATHAAAPRDEAATDRGRMPP